MGSKRFGALAVSSFETHALGYGDDEVNRGQISAPLEIWGKLFSRNVA